MRTEAQNQTLRTALRRTIRVAAMKVMENLLDENMDDENIEVELDDERKLLVNFKEPDGVEDAAQDLAEEVVEDLIEIIDRYYTDQDERYVKMQNMVNTIKAQLAELEGNLQEALGLKLPA